MDLFELLGRVAIDNKEGVGALQEVSTEGEKAESKLSKSFQAIGKGAAVVGKAIATGMAAGAAAVGALVTKSIQAYADYEQLVGGVDTLFKESSAKVQEYAENAYKTAGLSANEYMETVTSFSASLLQSLDGDTAKAADAANMAITDMSDNANKMGTSMEMIQNAYQGFAKQNYTMLDNLKLGYGGTKEEMQRLLEDAQAISGIEYDLSSYADVVDAIHVIQTEMGITGTTAKEASATISGSIASMKSSWQNLLTAISSDELPFDEYVNRFVESVTTVGQNILPRIEIALGGVVQLIQGLAPKIVEAIPGLLNTVLPAVIEAAKSLLQAVAGALPSALQAVTDALPALISGIVDVFGTLTDAIPAVIDTIVGVLPTIVPLLLDAVVQMVTKLAGMIPKLIKTIVNIIPKLISSLVGAIRTNLPILLDGLVTLLTEVVQILPTIATTLAEFAPVLLESLAMALIENLPILIEGLVQLITAIGTALPQIVQTVLEMMPTLLQMLVDQLMVLLPVLIEGLIAIAMAIAENLPSIILALYTAMPQVWMMILQALWELLPTILQGIWDLLVGIFSFVLTYLKNLYEPIAKFIVDLFGGSGTWDSIVSTISGALTAIGGAFKAAWDHIVGVWNIVEPYFKGIWEAIKAIFSVVGTVLGAFFKSAWEGIKLVFGVAVDYFKTIWNSIKNIFSAVKHVLSGNFSEAWEAIKRVFSGWGDFFGGLWDKVKNTFSKIGSNIADAIGKSVKAGLNGVIAMIEGTINTGINLINGAIGLINKIPGVEIGKLSKLDLPRLEKGGVLEKGQIGLLEGNGAEAVVPLDQNRAWISRVAQDMNVAVGGNNNGIIASLDEIRELLAQFFPDVMGALLSLGYAPDEAMVARWLAPAMNKEFGRLAIQEERGR